MRVSWFKSLIGKGDSRRTIEDKFDFVSCSSNGVHCKSILREINDLYRESELARINKEFQNAAEFLNKAYQKTSELSEPTCIKCADLFQKNIKMTIEDMREEVKDIQINFLPESI